MIGTVTGISRTPNVILSAGSTAALSLTMSAPMAALNRYDTKEECLEDFRGLALDLIDGGVRFASISLMVVLIDLSVDRGFWD